MNARTIFAIALAVSVPSVVLAEKEGVIEQFMRISTPVFDENGKEIERIESKKLPKTVVVEGFSKNGNLKAVINGRVVYFRRGDVKFNGPPTCVLSAESHRMAGMTAGGEPIGAKAGAGSSGKACIPVGR